MSDFIDIDYNKKDITRYRYKYIKDLEKKSIDELISLLKSIKSEIKTNKYRMSCFNNAIEIIIIETKLETDKEYKKRIKEQEEFNKTTLEAKRRLYEKLKKELNIE